MPELPPPSFFMIVQLHHLQAMLQLGLLPHPATGKPIPPNPAMARREQALLEILREKTVGNLTVEEEELLADVIGTVEAALSNF